MSFLRFVIPQIHDDTGVEMGLFTVAYKLHDGEDISQEDRETLQGELRWFSARLPVPKRFNRSKSKGYYRRATAGVCWYRDTAVEAIARMHKMKRIIEACGYVVEIIVEERIGFVVYQDEFQVVAEPFAEQRK